jgi:two-component system cell cycle response regulator CtrA
MADFEARCRLLETENESLRDRIFELEELLGQTFDSPAFLGLTASEGKLFGVLLAREAMTKTLAMQTLYGERPDADLAEEKIIDVLVCKMRAKLEEWNLPIETNWGQGYFMSAETKARARALIDERKAA